MPLASLRSIKRPLAKTPPSVSGILVFDTYTGANGTPIENRPPDIDVLGLGWNVESGAISIQSNRAVANVSSIYQISSGQSDVVVSSTVNLGVGNIVGLIVRFSDAANHWAIELRSGGNDFRIREISGGVSTIRAVTAFASSTNTDYEMSVTCVGTTITATLDGGNTISYNSATLNETIKRHGVIAVVGNNTQWNNFLVSSI